MDHPPPEFAASVAERVAAAGFAANISVRALAVQTGIPRATLIRRLNHPARFPFTVAELAAIAEVLGITVAALLLDAEPAA